MSLDALPKEVLFHIAYYLKFKDYKKLRLMTKLDLPEIPLVPFALYKQQTLIDFHAQEPMLDLSLDDFRKQYFDYLVKLGHGRQVVRILGLMPNLISLSEQQQT